MNNFDEHFKFSVMSGVSFPNAQFVHPIKQQCVQMLYDELWQDDNVLLMVVFGSAVDFRCHSHSDVDVYLERKDRAHYHSLQCDTEVDLIYDVQNKDSGIWQSIDRDGIVIFDRRDNSV